MGTQFATVTLVNARFDQPAATDATMLGEILDAATAQIAQYCGRWDRGTNLMLRQSALTEYAHGWGSNYLQLAMYPIESVTSVTIATDRDYDNGESLTENIDLTNATETYVVDTGMGGLYKDSGRWPTVRRSIKVVYTAGYVDPASTATAPQIALPKDIVEATILQTIHLYKIRKNPGIRSQAMEDGSLAYLDSRGLLEAVKAMVDPYRSVVVR